MLKDANLFDTSEYDFGKMKDETHGIPIEEYAGVRPKMYSIMQTAKNQQIEKTVKGIKKSATKNKSDMLATRSACMFEKKEIMASMNQIRGENHVNYLIKLYKIGLNPYDNKRYILDNG